MTVAHSFGRLPKIIISLFERLTMKDITFKELQNEIESNFSYLFIQLADNAIPTPQQFNETNNNKHFDDVFEANSIFKRADELSLKNRIHYLETILFKYERIFVYRKTAFGKKIYFSVQGTHTSSEYDKTFIKELRLKIKYSYHAYSIEQLEIKSKEKMKWFLWGTAVSMVIALIGATPKILEYCQTHTPDTYVVFPKVQVTHDTVFGMKYDTLKIKK